MDAKTTRWKFAEESDIIQSQSITPPQIINYNGKKENFIVEKSADTATTTWSKSASLIWDELTSGAPTA